MACEGYPTVEDAIRFKLNADFETEIVESQNEIATTPDGQPKLTIEGMAKKFGWIIAGDFSEGFTITSRNELGLDSNGDTWRWNGVIPYDVSAGTVPTSPDWDQIEIGTIIVGFIPPHNELEGREEEDAHPASAVTDTLYGDVDKSLKRIRTLAYAGVLA